MDRQLSRRAEPGRAFAQRELDLCRAAIRFNASGGIWTSSAGGQERPEALTPQRLSARLSELQARSYATLGWHLDRAMRRHASAPKIVSSFIAAVGNPMQPVIATVGAIWSLPEPDRKRAQATFARLAQTLAEILARGGDLGTVRRCDYPFVAHLILGLVLWTPVAALQAPTRKLLNRRRIVDGLQDFIIHGRSENRRISERPAPTPFQAAPDPRVATSRLINRAGAEAIEAAKPAAERTSTRAVRGDGLDPTEAVVASCQERTIELLIQFRDEAFPFDGQRRPGFESLIYRLAEACLRDDLQTLSPLAARRTVAGSESDPIRLSWRRAWGLIRPLQIDGVGNNELRTRFYDLSPIFVSAICAFLCTGLYEPEPDAITHLAGEVADFVWLGLSPNP